MKIGIDDISFSTSSYFLDMHTMAERRNAEYKKYSVGIGIERISIPAPDEDIITMAANAALPIVGRNDCSKIATVLFATESSVDQSKSAAVFVHALLGLPSTCRTVELKQACYSATAAIQAACALVERTPDKKVLVIASDIARYALCTPGEATQGCAAVAMLVTKEPRILEIAPESGCHSESTWDFWRPNYSTTPYYDGKLSMLNYIKTCKAAWKDLSSQKPIDFDSIDRFCYHLPFSTMGIKAHVKLAREVGSKKSTDELELQLAPSAVYCSKVGNCYSAAVYLALCSLLDNAPETLEGKKLAVFSYGSGCSGEFYTGTFQSGCKKLLDSAKNKMQLDSRKELDFDEYLDFYDAADILKKGGEDFDTPKKTAGAFRFCGVKNHRRIYERCF